MPVDGRVVALGMPSLRALMELPGVVVSGHVGRNVSRVVLGDKTAYIKREHRVRWRDRLRSFLDGFGPVSVSEREYRVIRRLREHGLPAPQPLARGEVDARAFLLLAEVEGAVELRRLPQVEPDLAAALGRIIAEIHNAGVDQPDLFAKHFLVDPGTGHITILDWQRARLCATVPWRNRVRSLAAFRATCSDSLLPPESWQSLLAAYASSGSSLNRSAFGNAVELTAATLLRKPSVRSQLVSPAAEQELVRIGGETVCVIPSLAGEIEQPDVIAMLYDPANNGRTLRFRDGRSVRLIVSRYRNPLSRWLTAVRGKSWRSPQLHTARLLFHLERYGIPAPRLLAYGQAVNGIFNAGSFVLTEPGDTRPATPAHGELLRALLHRLHKIGCCLRNIGDLGEPFALAGDTATISDDRYLRLNRRLSAHRMARDLRLLDTFLGVRR
ncbi:MAG TPA: lipopolysaccharide kinase InaA family protein [Gemmataceae bacterium]|nr:lipopolysaccharide kinase InaA family protein [Gemmataceae bacterium]